MTAPDRLRAVPARHPWRWVAIAVTVVLAAMFVHMLLTNPAFQWNFVWRTATTAAVLRGVRATVVVTVVAMAVGVVLGIVLAAMRLSGSRFLALVAAGYTWFFRAVPRLVLCFLSGNLGILYARVEFGLPFDHQLARLLGVSLDGRLFGFATKDVIAGLTAGTIALALSEGAYMAEIARAGILSVDTGQTEAAQALGMGGGLTFRRIVLPQAVRVMIPPTGNEVIAMLKDTSLLSAVPAYELYYYTNAIGARTFQILPAALAAVLWYLALTSVLLVVQRLVERRYGRGFVAGARGGG